MRFPPSASKRWVRAGSKRSLTFSSRLKRASGGVIFVQHQHPGDRPFFLLAIIPIIRGALFAYAATHFAGVGVNQNQRTFLTASDKQHRFDNSLQHLIGFHQSRNRLTHPIQGIQFTHILFKSMVGLYHPTREGLFFAAQTDNG